MFRVPLLVAVALVIAFGGGIFSALKALDATIGFGAIRLGAWEAFPAAQTADADPYAKAHRARAGQLLYGGAEGLSFTAAVDDGNQRLDARCTYRIAGQTPPSRLWTLFAATPDSRPLPLSKGLSPAINSLSVLRAADSSVSILVSARPQPGNWIALPPSGPFRLTLTLLDTPTAGSSGLIELSMPVIENLGCSDA